MRSITRIYVTKSASSKVQPCSAQVHTEQFARVPFLRFKQCVTNHSGLNTCCCVSHAPCLMCVFHSKSSRDLWTINPVMRTTAQNAWILISCGILGTVDVNGDNATHAHCRRARDEAKSRAPTNISTLLKHITQITDAHTDTNLRDDETFKMSMMKQSPEEIPAF